MATADSTGRPLDECRLIGTRPDREFVVLCSARRLSRSVSVVASGHHRQILTICPTVCDTWFFTRQHDESSLDHGPTSVCHMCVVTVMVLFSGTNSKGVSRPSSLWSAVLVVRHTFVAFGRAMADIQAYLQSSQRRILKAMLYKRRFLQVLR